MKKTGVRLDARISMLVIFTAAFALMMLGLGLVIFFVVFFSSQNHENIKYVLTNTSRQISENIQFVEDGVISVRHNSLLVEFLKSNSTEGRVRDEEAEINLAYSLDLFSERNRNSSGEPFVVRTYLINLSGGNISKSYYPQTIQTMDAVDEKYKELVKRFNSDDLRYNFYEGISDNTKILLIRLFDDSMKEMGICGVEINLNVVENIFRPLSNYNNFLWKVGFYPSGWESPQTLTGSPDSDSGFTNSLTFLGHENDINLVSKYSFGMFSVLSVDKSNIFYNFGYAAVALLVICVVVLILMAVRIVNLIRAVYDKELLATRTQVNYLQAQLNPHFQYNILAMLGIRAKAGGDEELYQSLRAFSKLVRGKIFEEKSIYIKLSEEMELVEFYLRLQRDRYGERISYDIDYDSNLGDCLIPKLIVEPLVENAVEHGLEPKENEGHVSIRVVKEEDILKITVEDDGVGIKDTQNKPGHTGTSLSNTRELLKVLYPNRHSILLERTDRETTLVTIKIPVKYD